MDIVKYVELIKINFIALEDNIFVRKRSNNDFILM